MLVYTSPKRMVDSNIFRSPYLDTKAEALEVLDNIRKNYSVELGWTELDGYVVRCSNGKWRAIRSHAKYE